MVSINKLAVNHVNKINTVSINKLREIKLGKGVSCIKMVEG